MGPDQDLWNPIFLGMNIHNPKHFADSIGKVQKIEMNLLEKGWVPRVDGEFSFTYFENFPDSKTYLYIYIYFYTYTNTFIYLLYMPIFQRPGMLKRRHLVGCRVSSFLGIGKMEPLRQTTTPWRLQQSAENQCVSKYLAKTCKSKWGCP